MSGVLNGDDLPVDGPLAADNADYTREGAYEAVQSLYAGDDEAVESYIASVEALDAGTYDGPLPLETFEDKFQNALKAYDHRTAGTYEPGTGSIYTGLDDSMLNKQEPVTGADIANAFLTADTYDAAKAELERFEQWLAPTLDNTTLQFDTDHDPLDGDQYQHLVTVHSFRRLIQRKYENMDSDEPQPFVAPDTGRNIDLASQL